MRNLIIVYFMFGIVISMRAQLILSLDSCRSLALANNKELLIGKEKIKVATYQRKAAFTNYLPKLSVSGSYMRNQREISILSDAQKGALGNLGTGLQAPLQQVIQQIQIDNPALAQKLAALGGMIIPELDKTGRSIADAFRTDTRNIFAGVITLTQPIYLGGKIRAYNEISRYAEELAFQQHRTGEQDVIMNMDEAYWQVISLVNKKKLADSYSSLLRHLDDDVQKMIREGVATKADGLSVRVKLNEAEMTLTKVEDGLSLSRMLLCQLCGLPLNSSIRLIDEAMDSVSVKIADTSYNLGEAYDNRPEIKGLELAEQIYQQKVKVVRSEFLPTLAAVGNYIVTNPALYNGFEKKFKGMWNVGVMLQIPIFHWGEGVYKVKAARAEAAIARYQLDQAKEKIELQVNQSAFKVNEANKKLAMAAKNMEKAEENLRYANVGFKEGVIATSNLLEAQTAWLQAHSEKIDAQIDVKLTEIYLKKSLGTLEK